MAVDPSPAQLRETLLREGASAQARTLIDQLRTLTKVCPFLLKVEPGLATLLHGPRVNRPLKPAASPDARTAISEKMKQAWTARNGTKPEAEVNPNTGKPYRISAKGRANMAAAAQKRAKKSKRRATVRATATAKDTKKKTRRPPMAQAQRALLAAAAKKRWELARAAGRTTLGPGSVNGAEQHVQ